MTASLPAAEDLGFVSLTLSDGGELRLAVSGIYAVENHRDEGTLIKTMGEMFVVQEVPELVFALVETLIDNRSKHERVRHVDEAVQFIRDNDIAVHALSDPPVHLLESDEKLKMLRALGYPIIEEGLTSEPFTLADMVGTDEDNIDYEAISRVIDEAQGQS